MAHPNEFNLRILLGGAAFSGPVDIDDDDSLNESELARILRDVADDIELRQAHVDEPTADDPAPLLDINGNRCGRWWFE